MPHHQIAYNVRLMVEDMASKGWMATDLARAADVADRSVGRFLNREVQTPKMADKLARALGFSVRRYLVRSTPEVAGATQ